MTASRLLGMPFKLTALAAILITLAFAVPAYAASGPRTWVVSADAPAGGNGTAARPFRTLAQVARASRPGDTIRVLPARKALGGGIALKARQTIVGAGPDVRSLPGNAPAPTLTNRGDSH